MPAIRSALLLFVLTATCAFAARPPPILATEKFTFHSDPWMNAHHFLYAWATLEKSDLVPRPHGVLMPDRTLPAGMDPEDRQAWTDAVEFYRRTFGAKSLTFDQGLITLKRRHWDPGPPLGAVPDEILATEEMIARVLPIYERHWWPAHDRSNRAWLASIRADVVRWEAPMSSALARIYGGTWPANPVTVDLVAYTDYYGAYNTGEPHVVLATAVAKNAYPHGIELLFHESSHSETLGNALYARVAEAAQSAQVRLPRDLWHALIFATTGELVRRHFAAIGVQDYIPYADKEGLFAPGTVWGRYKQLIDRFWLPRMDSPAAARADAYREMVRENARLQAEAGSAPKGAQ